MKTKIKQFPQDGVVIVENMGLCFITLYKKIGEVGEGEEKEFEVEYVEDVIRPMKNLRQSIVTNFDWYWNKAIKKQKLEEKEALISELNRIDSQTVRPLRAIESNQGTQEDRNKLAELETKARAVRAKIQELGV